MRDIREDNNDSEMYMLSIPVETATYLNKQLIGTSYRFFAAHSGVGVVDLSQTATKFTQLVIYLTIDPIEFEQLGRKFARK